MVESDAAESYAPSAKINDFKTGFVINYPLLSMVSKLITKVLYICIQ